MAQNTEIRSPSSVPVNGPHLGNECASSQRD